jgi:alkylhydroperoxidase family enzyme
MARIPLIDPAAVPDSLKALAEQISRERGGRVPNLYKALLNSPAIAAGWLHLGTAVRMESSLNGGMRELAICCVAQISGAEYEWRAHAPIAMKEGVSQAQIDALPDWKGSQVYTPAQRAVLAYAEQVTREFDADDATFAAVKEHFNDQEIMELTATIGFYNMVSRILRAIRVDHEVH